MHRRQQKQQRNIIAIYKCLSFFCSVKQNLLENNLDFIIFMGIDIRKINIESYCRNEQLNMKSCFSFVEISID
jgi:hypothetical protein